MSENLFDVHDIFSFMVFGSAFPVSEGVKVNLFESWVTEFVDSSFSHRLKGFSYSVCVSAEYMILFAWEFVKHGYKCWAEW